MLYKLYQVKLKQQGISMEQQRTENYQKTQTNISFIWLICFRCSYFLQAIKAYMFEKHKQHSLLWKSKIMK